MQGFLVQKLNCTCSSAWPWQTSQTGILPSLTRIAIYSAENLNGNQVRELHDYFELWRYKNDNLSPTLFQLLSFFGSFLCSYLAFLCSYNLSLINCYSVAIKRCLAYVFIHSPSIYIHTRSYLYIHACIHIIAYTQYSLWNVQIYTLLVSTVWWLMWFQSFLCVTSNNDHCYGNES